MSHAAFALRKRCHGVFWNRGFRFIWGKPETRIFSRAYAVLSLWISLYPTAVCFAQFVSPLVPTWPLRSFELQECWAPLCGGLLFFSVGDVGSTTEGTQPRSQGGVQFAFDRASCLFCPPRLRCSLSKNLFSVSYFSAFLWIRLPRRIACLELPFWVFSALEQSRSFLPLLCGCGRMMKVATLNQ